MVDSQESDNTGSISQTIRPIKWRLPQLSGDEFRLCSAWRSLLVSSEARQVILNEVVAFLERHLGRGISLSAEDISAKKYGVFSESIGDFAIVAVLGRPASGERALLVIDYALGGMMVDLLLGGNGERGAEPLPFTDTEQGLMQYMIMQLLAMFHQTIGDRVDCHFRFERFLVRHSEIAELYPPRETVVISPFRVTRGELGGFVQVVLPKNLLLRLADSNEGLMKDGEELARRALQLCGRDKVHLRAEIGRAELTPADIAGLEAGDVILFDDSTVNLRDGKPVGKAILRAGEGQHGGLICRLLESSTELTGQLEDWEE